MKNESLVIAQTKQWIQKLVIGCNFCPFASRVMKQQKVGFKVEFSKSFRSCLESFVQELIKLDADESIETSFIIYPEAVARFEEYLDLVDAAEKMIRELKYNGVYQVASFHPQYCFAGSDEQDAANFTNRAVFPMLHILRERSIDEALTHYEGVEKIPQRNIDFCREKGLPYMLLLRNSCI